MKDAIDRNPTVSKYIIYFNLVVIIMASITGFILISLIGMMHDDMQQSRQQRVIEHDTMNNRLNSIEHQLFHHNETSSDEMEQAVNESIIKNRSSLLSPSSIP